MAHLIPGVTFWEVYLRFLLSIFGIVIFLLSVKFGYHLLLAENISGTEFVSLVIAFAVIGLILSFASEVQEFSVAGNIVKLKEVKKDADKSIAELKSARTETFRFLLSLAKRHPGGISGGGTVDGRVEDFSFLYDQIVAFQCEDDLVNDIDDVVNILMKGQLYCISTYSDSLSSKYYGKDITPKPSQLTIEALDNESVEKAASRNVEGGDVGKIKERLVVGLDEYKKLYELHQKLQLKM